MPQRQANRPGREHIGAAAARGRLYGPEPSTLFLRWNSAGRSSTCSLLHIRTEPKARLLRDVFGWAIWGTRVIGREYFARQAATLLKFAKATTNPQLAAILIGKAADLKSQVDESSTTPGPSPQVPDVQPED